MTSAGTESPEFLLTRDDCQLYCIERPGDWNYFTYNNNHR
jgi:hypothetical protein